MSTTVKFKPTHEISYSEPPDDEPESWLVSLREDGTAVDRDGRINRRGAAQPSDDYHGRGPNFLVRRAIVVGILFWCATKRHTVSAAILEML